MIRERLLALSDYDYSCVYEILESPMGVDELRRHAQAHAGHRRRALLRRMERRVRLRRGARARAGRDDRQRRLPGRLRRAEAPLRQALSAVLQHVVRSTVIDAPIERVWAVLRDFNSHDQWHDVVAESRIEGGERSDQVGCVRSFTLKDGNRIREQLLTLSDSEYKSTYCIVEATVPLQRYVATRDAEAGDRRRPHLLALGVDLRDAARAASASCARWWRNGRLRGRLREPAPPPAPGRRPARGRRGAAMPTALPLPARRVVVHRYGGPEVLQPGDGEAPAPGRRRGAHPPARDRRQLPRRLPAQGLDPGDAAAARRAGHGGGGHGGRRRRRTSAASCPATASPTSARCRAPTAACARCRPNGSCACPPAIDDDVAAATLLKGITADFLLRDLGHVGAGTRLLVHAAAGGVGLLVCAWARRLGATVIGTVSSEEKARVAREYGCAHPIVTREHRFADAVQAQFGGADVVDRRHRRRRARRELRRAGAARPLDQPRPGERRAAADRARRAGARSRSPSRARWCSTTSRRHASLAERAGRVWAALADGTLKAPPIERHALGAAAEAHARLESRRTIGALVLIA